MVTESCWHFRQWALEFHLLIFWPVICFSFVRACVCVHIHMCAHQNSLSFSLKTLSIIPYLFYFKHGTINEVLKDWFIPVCYVCPASYLFLTFICYIFRQPRTWLSILYCEVLILENIVSACFFCCAQAFTIWGYICAEGHEVC
jgi:hypothetical protein